MWAAIFVLTTTALVVIVVAWLLRHFSRRRPRSYLRRVARFLAAGYGHHPQYTVDQVQTAVARTRGSARCRMLAYAAFLKQTDFDQLAARETIAGQYSSLQTAALRALRPLHMRGGTSYSAVPSLPPGYPIDVAGVDGGSLVAGGDLNLPCPDAPGPDSSGGCAGDHGAL
jgi:hypothetical protein